MRGLIVGSMLCCASLARADWMDHFVNRDDVGPHKAPSLGDTRVVLIPIEVAGFPPFDRSALEAFYAPTGPFVSFYETASLGRYRPRVTVAPTVHYERCPLPEARFPGCSVARGDLAAFTAGMSMIREVLQRTDEAGFDFTPFDVTGRKGTPDGWLDGVMLLTNVPFGGIAFPFGYFNQDDNLAGGRGGPLIVDGKQAGHFAIAGDSDTWVMVHEFGHLLGLTDLYDESQRTDGLWLSWMGAWSYDVQIPLPDAETRFRLRWADWRQVQGRQRVVIAPVEPSGQVYRLGTGDEYFLVENRGPGGAFDRALPERGLAIFHVDRGVKLSGATGSFVDRILDCVNCDAWHPYIRLVQADGRFDIEHGRAFGAGDLFTRGSLGADSSGIALGAVHAVNATNWYDGGVSGLSVDDVQVLDDGSIEVTLTAPDEGQCGDRLCAEGPGCAPETCGAPPGSPGCSSAPGLALGLALLLLEQRLGRRKQR